MNSTEINKAVAAVLVAVFSVFRIVLAFDNIRTKPELYTKALVEQFNASVYPKLQEEINESIKKTSVKPGGSVPLLAGVEGGMKSPTSKYYMRTIRIDHISPLIPALKEAGYRMEPDRTTPRTTVVYFPCEAKGSARLAKDVSLWEQAAVYTALQRHWADNMVSATLMFQPHEAQDIARVLKVYEGQWKAISFLPLSDHGYLQAPYTPCSEDEYLYAVSKLKPVAFDGLQIGHDTDDKYCAGGVCELPVTGS